MLELWLIGLSNGQSFHPVFSVLVFYLSFVATVFVCFRLWSNSMYGSR